MNKFLKADKTFINVSAMQHVEFIESTIPSETLYLQVDFNKSDVKIYIYHDKKKEIVEQLVDKFFKFLNYANSPGVFDVYKHTEDIINSLEGGTDDGEE